MGLTGAVGARLPRALYSQRVNEMAKLRAHRCRGAFRLAFKMREKG
jgi:hypothetical protein